MSEILFRYERVVPTSWAYISSLMMIALFFKFNRLWSVRNFDLLGLIAFAPGLLLIKYGVDHAGQIANAQSIEHLGYVWLFVISGIFLVRLLMDTAMVRRPLLEPNMTAGGLAFLVVSLLLFLMANVLNGTPSKTDLAGSQRAAQLRQMQASSEELNSLQTHGPGFTLIYEIPYILTDTFFAEGPEDPSSQGAETPAVKASPDHMVHQATAKIVVILSQLMIVLGMILIGYRHFDNMRTGVAAAGLYLLLPYTALWTGSATHALPGALLVWAIVVYRKPLLAGAMIGLAFGTIYYPIFLLPLWISFYWDRGRTRFLIGLVSMITVFVLLEAFTSADSTMFLARLRQMFGVRFPIMEGLSGIWQFWNSSYRIPILAGCIGLSLSFAIWPAQKNLGTLMSGSAAIMLAVQFWHAHSGGLALAWYFPLLLLTIFRPNLEDCVAQSVIGQAWFQRKNAPALEEQAA